MKFKKIKYNLICILMVLLVTASVVIKVTFFSDQGTNSDLLNQSQGQQIPNSPLAPGNADTQTSSEEFAENYEKDLNLPSTKFPYTLINYCFNKFAESQSFKTDIDFRTTFSVPALSAKADQHIYGTSVKFDGNKRYEDIVFDAEGMAKLLSPILGLQKTYYDGQNYHRWKTDTGVYDITKANYTTCAQHNDPNFRFYYDFLSPDFVNRPALSLNKKGAQVTAMTDNKNGIIKVSVKLSDKNYYPLNFLRSYETFSPFIEITSMTQTISFEIDQKSGYIKKMYKVDDFVGPYNFQGMDVIVNMHLVHQQTFSGYNQPQQITHPPIPEKQKSK